MRLEVVNDIFKVLKNKNKTKQKKKTKKKKDKINQQFYIQENYPLE